MPVPNRETIRTAPQPLLQVGKLCLMFSQRLYSSHLSIGSIRLCDTGEAVIEPFLVSLVQLISNSLAQMIPGLDTLPTEPFSSLCYRHSQNLEVKNLQDEEERKRANALVESLTACSFQGCSNNARSSKSLQGAYAHRKRHHGDHGGDNLLTHTLLHD